jgi:murein DD-endopeptidase MepM/ murein hydrolase activator NlpD
MLRLLGRYPDAASFQPKARYRLPLEGEWFTMNGGVSPASSHSWDLLTQRYAYDFVKVDEQLRRHSGDGTRPEQYFCWDQPIIAAADGEVVRVRDGVRTAPWLGQYIVDFLGTDFRGNFVVVKHAEGEFGFYAHLIRGKIAVKVGDRLKSGQELGRCGHSGHSTEPHLHFHLQDHPSFFLGMGLPIKFHDVLVDGESLASGYLRGGQRVGQA